MPYDPEKHHRRSIRLRGYDYSAPGKYFVTICVQHRECLYGEVINGEMKLNDAGRMVEKWWRELANKFPLVDLDEHVTMPNHFHGIIVIVDRREREKDLFHARKSKDQIAQAMASVPEKSAPLPEIVQWFKTITTNEYIRGVKELGWPRFDRKLWQRNYYEHTIFSLRALRNIRQYIRANPLMWPYDRDNLESIAPDRKKISSLLEENFGGTDEDLDFILRFDNEYYEEEESEL
jgi:REP-associated tyrosine transposase